MKLYNVISLGILALSLNGTLSIKGISYAVLMEYGFQMAMEQPMLVLMEYGFQMAMERPMLVLMEYGLRIAMERPMLVLMEFGFQMAMGRPMAARVLRITTHQAHMTCIIGALPIIMIKIISMHYSILSGICTTK